MYVCVHLLQVLLLYIDVFKYYNMRLCPSLSMQEAMDELAPGNKIVMKRSEDGSGRGAAIVAAVACRLTEAGR